MAFIDLARLRLPGEINGPRIPAIWIGTAADDEDDIDVIDDQTSHIWFVDRAGWEVAWRLVRMINRGARVRRCHIGRDVRLHAEFSAHHFEGSTV